MHTYPKSTIDAILALFSAFDIGISLETNPIMPLTIYTNIYRWSDGSYRDYREPENADGDAFLAEERSNNE